MKNKLLFCGLAILLISGCVDHNQFTDQIREGMSSSAGFWRGMWHGICAPISLIGIMFGMKIGLYESFNTGNWYNFGFLIGVGLWGGSSSSASKKSK